MAAGFPFLSHSVKDKRAHLKGYKPIDKEISVSTVYDFGKNMQS